MKAALDTLASAFWRSQALYQSYDRNSSEHKMVTRIRDDVEAKMMPVLLNLPPHKGAK